MGYRSNVKIFLVETDKKLEEIIEESKKIENFGNFTIGKNKKGNRVLMAEFNDTKWYQGYNLVSYWDNIMSKTDDSNYLFTKLGERVDDVTTDGEYGKAHIFIDTVVDDEFGESYSFADIEYNVDFFETE